MPTLSLNIKCCENIKDEKRTVQTLWDSFGEPDSWPGEEPKPQKGIGFHSIDPRNWSISLWSIMDRHSPSWTINDHLCLCLSLYKAQQIALMDNLIKLSNPSIE